MRGPMKPQKQCICLLLMTTALLSLLALMQQGFTVKLIKVDEASRSSSSGVNDNKGDQQQGVIETQQHKDLNFVANANSLKARLLTLKPQPHQQLHVVVTKAPAPVLGQHAVAVNPAYPLTLPAPINPIPTQEALKKMSEKDLVNFYHSYVMSPQSTCSKVRRMGNVKDGGWEMCDDPLYKPNATNCLIYSFGINYDFTYDDDMAEYGCTIHAFDPSMYRVSDHLRKNRIHFHLTGIGERDEKVLRGNPRRQWQLYTMNTHRNRLGHLIGKKQIDIIKMDVEGSELTSLTTALKQGALSDLKQLSWETHLSLNGHPVRDRYISYLVLMRGLWDAGFRIYHTSRNHVWSAFQSPVIRKPRVTCHEINMVNINNKNPIVNTVIVNEKSVKSGLTTR